MARKYGGSFRYYHSGITPIAADFPQTLSYAEKKERIELAVYQKRTFYGFTTGDLVDLDAIDSRVLKACDLGDDGSIHTMLSRPRWAPWEKTLPKFATIQTMINLGPLRPALSITSRLLHNLHIIPFASYPAPFNHI